MPIEKRIPFRLQNKNFILVCSIAGIYHMPGFRGVLGNPDTPPYTVTSWQGEVYSEFTGKKIAEVSANSGIGGEPIDETKAVDWMKKQAVSEAAKWVSRLDMTVPSRPTNQDWRSAISP